jgi:hypothetical protein
MRVKIQVRLRLPVALPILAVLRSMKTPRNAQAGLPVPQKQIPSVVTHRLVIPRIRAHTCHSERSKESAFCALEIERPKRAVLRGNH